jgi:hypothetical protein
MEMRGDNEKAARAAEASERLFTELLTAKPDPKGTRKRGQSKQAGAARTSSGEKAAKGASVVRRTKKSGSARGDSGAGARSGPVRSPRARS